MGFLLHFEQLFSVPIFLTYHVLMEAIQAKSSLLLSEWFV